MRASKFKRFKKSLDRHIADFSIEADKSFNLNDFDDDWEMPVWRHSAAEILVWILDKTGATLRKSQLVEAWRCMVTKCWNIMDFEAFTEQDREAVLGAIAYFKAKALRNTECMRAENLLDDPVRNRVRQVSLA